MKGALQKIWTGWVGPQPAEPSAPRGALLGNLLVWPLLIQAAVVSGALLFPPLFSDLRDSLGRSDNSLVWWVWLFPTASLFLLELPGALVFVWGDARLKPQIRWLGAALLLIGALTALADAALYQRFGRHLSDVLVYLKNPEAGAAAGNTAGNIIWALMLLFWALLSVAFYVLVFRGALGLLRVRKSLTVRLTLLVGAALALPLLACLWLIPPLLPDGFGPRLTESMPLRPAVSSVDGDFEPKDPALRRLQAQLRVEYRRLFPFVFRPHESPLVRDGQMQIATTEGALPDIALIVAESLRWEMLTAEHMPRLFAWSKKGLRAERHYSVSNHSEAGLFALLYGQSPLRFNVTLDQRTPPTLCTLLRSVGYRCGYYTGHPKIWLRREEFLNERTMDDFVHTGDGDWNNWDRSALTSAARHLADSRPRFALTFLMSSHYEYRYPSEYRIHTPDDPPKTGWLPGQARREEFEACRNRYRNVTAFLDDLIADHIETLDPERTLILFTGDHGEATGENGRFGHGYSFSDPLTRVPFVMVGPGVAPEVRQQLTSHLDVLPTLLQAAGLTAAEGTLGAPLQEKNPERPLLLTYTTVGRPIADGLLLTGDLRLSLRFDPTRPNVDVLGFQNPDGSAVQISLTEKQERELVAAFISELTKSGRSVAPQTP